MLGNDARSANDEEILIFKMKKKRNIDELEVEKIINPRRIENIILSMEFIPLLGKRIYILI